jgi:predicted nicotinamide N-methyase
MNYPIQLNEFEAGLTLFIPAPEKVKATYEQLFVLDNLTPFPFWAKIWASSKALTSFLIQHPNWIEGKRVLEIGAGIGQPSFTIANKTKDIVISDHNQDAVALINHNIKHLARSNVSALCLDWNDSPWNLQADVILLSDINYAPDQFEPLLKLIQYYINLGSKIIIATPQRIMASPFIEKLASYIQINHVHSIAEENTNVPISIYVLFK